MIQDDGYASYADTFYFVQIGSLVVDRSCLDDDGPRKDNRLFIVELANRFVRLVDS